MILRTFGTVLLTALLSVPAATAWAEHAEDSGEDQPAQASEAEASGQRVDLPWDAVNWVSFDYQSDEAIAEAAQHGVHAPGAPVIAAVFNFALLLLILYFIARKPLSAFLQARSDGVREGLIEAKKMLEEANERLAEYSSRLERMDEEMTKLREEFIAAGEAERDRLVADAGAKSERMRRDAEVRLGQEFAQLREELRVETVDKAVAAATSLLRETVKDTDQRRLAEEYLEQVEREEVGR